MAEARQSSNCERKVTTDKITSRFTALRLFFTSCLYPQTPVQELNESTEALKAPSQASIKRRANDKGNVTFSPLLCHSLGPGSSPSRRTLSQDHQCVARESPPSPVIPKMQSASPVIRHNGTSSSGQQHPVSPRDRCSSGQVVLGHSPLPSSLCRSRSREPEVSGDMLSYALRVASGATGATSGSAEISPRSRYRSQGRSNQTSFSPTRIEKPLYPQAYSVSVYSTADNWASTREPSYTEVGAPLHQFNHQLNPKPEQPRAAPPNHIGGLFSHRRSSGPASLCQVSTHSPTSPPMAAGLVTSTSASAYLLNSVVEAAQDVSVSSRRSARSELAATGDLSHRGNSNAVFGRGRSYGGGMAGSNPSSAAEVPDYGYARRGHSSHSGTSVTGGHSFVPLAQYLSSRKSITGGFYDAGRSCQADVFQTESEGVIPIQPAGLSRNNSYAGQPASQPSTHHSSASIHSQSTSSGHCIPGSSPPLTSSGMFSASGILLPNTSAPHLPALGGSIWSERGQATTLGARSNTYSSGTNASERSSVVSTYERSSVCTNDRSSVCTNDRSSVSTNDRSSIVSNDRSSNADRNSAGSQMTNMSGAGGFSNRAGQNYHRSPSGVVFNPAMGLHEDTVYSWIGASGGQSVSVPKLQRHLSQRRGGGAADGGLRPGSIKTSNENVGKVDYTITPAAKDWRVDSQSSQRSLAASAVGVLHSSCSATVEGGAMSAASLTHHHSAPLWRSNNISNAAYVAPSSSPPGPQHRCSPRFAAWAAKQQDRTVTNSKSSTPPPKQQE